MPTLLVQHKMHPALRARIAATLKRSSGGGGRRLMDAPTAIAALRVLAVLSIVSLAVALYVVRKRAQERFEHKRASIVAAIQSQTAVLTDDDRRTLPRVEAWIAQFSQSYDGDVVTDEARSFDAMIARETIYLRGPLPDYTDAKNVAPASEQSAKDTFLACLFSPPTARTEDIVLAHLHAVGETMEQRTSNVVLLRDAELGAKFISPAWITRIEQATSLQELALLQHDQAHAPIDAAVKASRARQLLVVLDEVAAGGGFAELEGDRPHTARVAVVELPTERVLLRLRKEVDPTWISSGRKRKYSLSLDGCVLAMDVREAAK